MENLKLKNVKMNIKKYIKLGLVFGAVYAAGRVTCFIDTVNKYKDNINLDELDMGVLRANGKSRIGWIRPKK